MTCVPVYSADVCIMVMAVRVRVQRPVIRQKLAAMVADVESVHSMLEDVTFQARWKPTPRPFPQPCAFSATRISYEDTDRAHA